MKNRLKYIATATLPVILGAIVLSWTMGSASNKPMTTDNSASDNSASTNKPKTRYLAQASINAEKNFTH